MRILCCALLIGCPGPSIDETETGTDVTDGSDHTDDPSLTDIDGDGYLSDVDCDDFDPEVRPNATEVLWNDKDDNCDGRVDANGRFQGDAAVLFVATVEGRTYRWNLSCPATVDRAGWQLDLNVVCTAPPDDDLAVQVMGETFSYVDKDNIVEEAEFSGAIVVSSSDGWAVDGTGSVSWRSDQAVTAQGSMRSRFASSSMTLSATYVE